MGCDDDTPVPDWSKFAEAQAELREQERRHRDDEIGRPLGYDGPHNHPKEQECTLGCPVMVAEADRIGALRAQIAQDRAEVPGQPDRPEVLALMGRLGPRKPGIDMLRRLVGTLDERPDFWDGGKVLWSDTTGNLITDGAMRRLRDEVTLLEMRKERAERAAGLLSYFIEQTLGKALGYPEYGPEMFEDGKPNGDVCVGEHTPETLALEAARRLREAREMAATHPGVQRIADAVQAMQKRPEGDKWADTRKLVNMAAHRAMAHPEDGWAADFAEQVTVLLAEIDRLSGGRAEGPGQ